MNARIPRNIAAAAAVAQCRGSAASLSMADITSRGYWPVLPLDQQCSAAAAAAAGNPHAERVGSEETTKQEQNYACLVTAAAAFRRLATPAGLELKASKLFLDICQFDGRALILFTSCNHKNTARNFYTFLNKLEHHQRAQDQSFFNLIDL
ncbi:hypothetical protein TSAR_006190, partial [Trichomalopsis sarcophagae]